MDALSKIFDDIHLNKSEFIYLNPQGTWAFQYQDHSAIIAYVVLSGELYLELSTQRQVYAQAGDIVLIPSGCSHVGKSSTQLDWLDALDISDLFQRRRQQTIEFGEASGEKSFILAMHGTMDSIMAKPLLNALPDYMHIHHIMSSTAPEWLQIGLQFLAVESHQIRPGRDKILDHLISILFIECVRDYIAQLNDSNNWLSALTHPELSNALTAIHGQPEKMLDRRNPSRTMLHVALEICQPICPDCWRIATGLFAAASLKTSGSIFTSWPALNPANCL